MTPQGRAIRRKNLQLAAAMAAGGGLLLWAWSNKEARSSQTRLLQPAGQVVGALSLFIGTYALGLGYGVLPGA